MLTKGKTGSGGTLTLEVAGPGGTPLRGKVYSFDSRLGYHVRSCMCAGPVPDNCATSGNKFMPTLGISRSNFENRWANPQYKGTPGEAGLHWLYRNKVERFFSRLKQFRRLVMRYYKTASSFLRMVHFISALLWLR